MIDILKIIKRILACCESKLYSSVLYLQFKLFGVDFLSLPQIAGIISLRSTGKVVIGKNVKITSRHRRNLVGTECRTIIFVAPKAVLAIGNNCGLSNCTIYCACGINIDDNVLIGGGARLYDTDFHSIDPTSRASLVDGNIKKAPIRLGKNSFIGAHAIILKGVDIGENSVVGAGSVVASDIPSDEIWAGNPAKFVRKMDKFIG